MEVYCLDIVIAGIFFRPSPLSGYIDKGWRVLAVWHPPMGRVLSILDHLHSRRHGVDYFPFSTATRCPVPSSRSGGATRTLRLAFPW